MTDPGFRARPIMPNPLSVSRPELARFLKRLADLYKDPVTGNPALSLALFDLSRELSREPGGNAVTQERRHPVWHKGLDELEKLDAEAVKAFISDETKSKSELIELANVRFSIPHSRLMKMRIRDIRDFIKSALLHEDSITAIAEQARKSGTHRSS
jgi:hypothetical protein